MTTFTRPYTRHALLLMLDVLGVKALAKTEMALIENRYAYYFMWNFFEDCILLLEKNFRDLQVSSFGYGDTLCTYVSLWDPRTEDLSSPAVTQRFVKKVAKLVSSLLRRGFVFRGYLADGDMMDINPQDLPSIEEVIRVSRNSLRVATSLGTALLGAVELERRGICSAGLFVTAEMADRLNIGHLGTPETKVAEGPRVVAVNMAAYLTKRDFAALVNNIRGASQQEQTDLATVEAWYERRHWQENKELREAEIRQEMLLRIFRNQGKHYVLNLLSLLETKQ